MIGGFGVAKLPDSDRTNVDLIEEIYSFLDSIYRITKNKYESQINLKKNTAEKILSEIKTISKDIKNIVKTYKKTGRFKAKCSECPRLIRYLIPPW